MGNDVTRPTSHCWHTSEMQHAVPYHSDEFCCWCDKSICRTFVVGRASHCGPYAPADVIEDEHHDADDEKCPAR